MKTSAGETRKKPRIVLRAEDHDRLSQLAQAALARQPDLAEELSEELERAHVVAKGRYPQHTVCMDCEVEFHDDATGKAHRVTLVYPEQADIAQGRISVLTPIGTALIGLQEGDAMEWQTRSGEWRRLRVIAVRAPESLADRQRSSLAG